MKRLSMIVLLGFAFLAAFFLNMYLEKITAQLDPFSNNYIYYSYDENMHLQTIHTVNAWGDTIVTKEFEDEKLVLQYGPGLTYQLEYTADTVYEYRLQPNETFALSFLYVINSMYQVTKSILVDPLSDIYLGSQDYQWSAGNCTGVNMEGMTMGSYTYDTDVQNPLYNQYKYQV